MNCAKCKSSKLKKYKYMNIECYECSECGYDSCSELDDVPEQRQSQKQKGRYTPYKIGGSKRTK